MSHAVVTGAITAFLALLGTIIAVRTESKTASKTNDADILRSTNTALAARVDQLNARLDKLEFKQRELEEDNALCRRRLYIAVDNIRHWSAWHAAGMRGAPPALPEELKDY